MPREKGGGPLAGLPLFTVRRWRWALGLLCLESWLQWEALTLAVGCVALGVGGHLLL